ncbi:MAG: GspE/PulE family protein [Desulfopila sp.]|jgi:type IV pilus assembly protein PilB|nr:GspE/PulE family protein [Desulfopila sp.]
MAMQKAPSLGKLLKEQGLVTEEQIVFSLHEQKATGELMGACLMRLGILTDSDLARVLAKQSDFPFTDLRTVTPDQKLLAKVPYRIAKQFQFLVLFEDEGALHIAVANPFSTVASEQAYRTTGQKIVVYVGGEIELQKLIERFYYLLENPVEQEINTLVGRLRRNPGGDVDVDKLVDNLLGVAVSYRVTDMHISPSDISSRIMLREDGVLRPAHVFPSGLHNRLITNIKVRAGMDISEQRKPQDGRMSFEFLGEVFDIRISTIRTNFGENMVMRLLASKGSSVFNINDLGFEPETVNSLERLFSAPYGMVLVTGPTGSGKSTTLYAALRQQDAIGKNILTIEDPIEYQLLMIRQTQVNEKAGYTFASAIRSFLRQDPDVMLVGEIRDEETAILGVRAALTGHLVLSTLHTNTALGALARLKDLGVSSYLISTSLVGVLAQRLVRKLCVNCRAEGQYSAEQLKEYNLPPDGIYFKAVGCNQCRDTGYRGRECVSELLLCSENILRLVADDAPLGVILDQARKEGFSELVNSGRQKVMAGNTSIEELRRVLG